MNDAENKSIATKGPHAYLNTAKSFVRECTIESLPDGLENGTVMA